MAGSRIALDAQQSDNARIAQIGDELLAVEPGQALALIRVDEFRRKGLPLALGYLVSLVNRVLRLARRVAGREIQPVCVGDAQLRQTSLQPLAVGEGILRSAHATPTPDVAQRVDLRVLQRTEKGLRVPAVDADSDKLSHPRLPTLLRHRTPAHRSVCAR